MILRILRPGTGVDAPVRRLPWAVDLFALVTTIWAAIIGLLATDYFTRLTMLGAVVGCLVAWRYMRDPLVVIAITTMVFAGAVLGWGLEFYDRVWWFDKSAHFLLSLSGTMAIARLVLHRFRVDSALLLLTALWLAWLGIGSLWEIGEWVADRVEGTRHSRGYFDTLYDMIWNSIGAGVGAWMYWRWFRTDADRLVIETAPVSREVGLGRQSSGPEPVQDEV